MFTPTTIGSLSLAGAAVWAAHRRRLTDRVTLVDAGSGSTRVVCLGTRRSDGAVRVAAGPVRVPARLGDALGGGGVDAWAADVAEGIRAVSSASTPVRGAGTAGARDALKKAGEADLGRAGRGVEAALRRHAPRATFEVLDGASEARLELVACRACRPDAGLLAGGGKSIQVASSFDDARSIDVDSFAGHDLIRKHGARAGAMMHEWAVRRTLANVLGGDGVRGYKGAFSLIELAASSFEAAGGAGELSRADFVEALQARRAALERELNPSESVADRARANDPHNDKLVKDLVYATSLIAFVDLAFAKDATFSTLPARAVGSAPATNWALGLYLEQRGMLP